MHGIQSIHNLNRVFLVWLLLANALLPILPDQGPLGSDLLWSLLIPLGSLVALNPRRSLALVLALLAWPAWWLASRQRRGARPARGRGWLAAPQARQPRLGL